MAQHILVVDDEISICRLLKIILQSSGYRITTATDAAQGMSIMKSDPPDLVLLDIMMPQVDGWAVLQAASMPVVVISAAGTDKAVEKALAMGARRYVLKPFTRDDVLKVVEEVLTGPVAR